MRLRAKAYAGYKTSCLWRGWCSVWECGWMGVWERIDLRMLNALSSLSTIKNRYSIKEESLPHSHTPIPPHNIKTLATGRLAPLPHPAP